MEAFEFCLEWKPHRAWLKANNIDLNGMEDEQLYQQHLVEYKFDKLIL
jgi:hypothetical protein